MAAEVRPIRTKRDHAAALEEVERLWGAKAGTREGD
jgi:HTH-type transcriptional regulator/antitoxin HigA